MMCLIRKAVLLGAVATAFAAAVWGQATAQAAPTKLLINSRLGAKVNQDGSSFCLVGKCKPSAAEASIAPGGFKIPNGVAFAPNGNIYVADNLNNRVQELKSTGEFVLMFGKEVNETKVNAIKAKGGTPNSKELKEEDLCTQAEIEAGAKCKAGIGSGESGGLYEPRAVAVDPVSRNVYVAEASNYRVDEYTESGQFVLMIGREVNELKVDAIRAKGGIPSVKELEEENLCTQVEVEAGGKCEAGVRETSGIAEHGAFNMDGKGSELSVGGPQDLLYVGDEHRVQEFGADGTWLHDISLTSISLEPESTVRAVVVNQTTGDVYVGYFLRGADVGEPENVIHTFNSADKEICKFVLPARQPGRKVEIQGIALDANPSGLLAVVEREGIGASGAETTGYFGSLLDSCTGKRVTEFAVSTGGQVSDVPSIGFNAAGELYAALLERNEIVGYLPRIVTELVTGVATCVPENLREALVTFECQLNGKVNPENVAGTEVWFAWGTRTETGETSRQPIPAGATLVAVAPSTIKGLRPNETFSYELLGYDQVNQAPEAALMGGRMLTVVPVVPPRVVGEPNVSFVKFSSAVMSGDINPENAETRYRFQYAEVKACEELERTLNRSVAVSECPGMSETPAQESAVYQKITTTQEAKGLQPNTRYRYRLFGVNEKGQPAVNASSGKSIDEAEFKTAPAPVPEAITGPPSAIGATSAAISGLVNSDGQPAVYTFELGLYNGATTSYGRVLSGSVSSGAILVEEAVTLSGLQPGTRYSYRIGVASAYGTSYGAQEIFTTAGRSSVPEPPVVLAQLPVPKILFPIANKAKGCRHGRMHDKQRKCGRAKKRRAQFHGKRGPRKKK